MHVPCFRLGFHEAIGDTMALAVNTPTHLRAVGLLPPEAVKARDLKEDIGYLFHVALQKVVKGLFRTGLTLF